MEIRPQGRARHVALLGPTATGKSELAFELARLRPGAELVSVDSMCVYRHMDIGTAKPSPDQTKAVPYHLIDLVDPSEEFTLRQFQDAADAAVSEIEGRGRRALLVAGTALYLRCVVDHLELPGRWPQVARELEADSESPGGLAHLYERLESLDPLGARRILPQNRRRVVRALEVTIGSGRPFSSFGPGLDYYPPTPFVLVGLPFDPAIDDARIESRLEAMLDAGLLDEVKRLAARPGGLSRTARQALAYKELLSHLEERVPLEEALSETLRRTRSFARRQWRWFRRDPRVVWLDRSSDLLRQLLDLWDTASLVTVGD